MLVARLTVECLKLLNRLFLQTCFPWAFTYYARDQFSVPCRQNINLCQYWLSQITWSCNTGSVEKLWMFFEIWFSLIRICLILINLFSANLKHLNNIPFAPSTNCFLTTRCGTAIADDTLFSSGNRSLSTVSSVQCAVCSGRCDERQPYRVETFEGFLVVLRFSRWQFFQYLCSLPNFHLLLLLLVMFVSFSLLIRHLSSQSVHRLVLAFIRWSRLFSNTRQVFGPLCYLLDNNVIIYTKTLNSVCFLFSR